MSKGKYFIYQLPPLLTQVTKHIIYMENRLPYADFNELYITRHLQIT